MNPPKSGHVPPNPPPNMVGRAGKRRVNVTCPYKSQNKILSLQSTFPPNACDRDCRKLGSRVGEPQRNYNIAEWEGVEFKKIPIKSIWE
jgi:hypothetical protein